MSIRPFILTFACLVATLVLTAQNQAKIDSLENLLKTNIEDTTRIITLNALGWELHQNDPDTAIILSTQALSLAEKKRWDKGIGISYHNLGACHFLQGNFEIALTSFRKALKIREGLGDKKNIASTLGGIGVVYENMGNYSKANKHNFKALKMNEEVANREGVSVNLSNIGLVYMKQGNYTKALKYHQDAMEIDIELNRKSGIAANLTNIGNIYVMQGDYPKTLEYYLNALKMYEELGNKNNELTQVGNIGAVYHYIADYQKALKYFSKALKMAKELGNKNRIASNLGGIGSVYKDIGSSATNDSIRHTNHKKALEYYFKALKMAKELEYKALQETTLGNIGGVYAARDSYIEAFEYYSKALNIAEELGNKKGMARNLANIGSLFIDQNKYLEAKKSLQQGLEIANEIGDLELQKHYHKYFSKLYEQTGKPAKALEHYKLYIEARDSLFNEQNTKEITQREMQYEFDKQQEKEKAEQEKKDAIAAEELKREKTIGYSFMGGFGLLLVLAFVVFRSLQQKKKANRVITEQKQEVEHQKELVDEKNTEIMDSITYAKRIQEAILPPDRLVKEYLKDSFILYKPKDIVAGDFYWMEEAPLNPPKGGKQEALSNSHKGEAPLPLGKGLGDGLLLFAAADCTGHGVPGAMVSVVCHNAMNRAVREFGLRSPAEILDKTNELVEETFEKSESEVKDGMDLALCCLNTKTNELQYAGANNPLYHLTNGEIKEIKADKQPIGSYEGRKPYTNHSMTLQKGDSIYLFSDGFADQFGGPKGKKFKYKPFRELLLANHSKPMEEQKKLLDECIENWRGELEQVDDICIIGVKL